MQLTERELNVLYCLAHGINNNAIGKKLNISEHTVKAHLESIYEKLTVENRIQAVIRAIQTKLIDINTINIKVTSSY
ncbi:MAG: LuxR C-terminal-related transcriptional regulator [bacterium]|nr:LuxR C-terminal-related transcriptional regulator [bacterium]